MKLTKQQALEKIKELKKYVAEKDKKPSGYVIYDLDGNRLFTSSKDNVKEAVEEAVWQRANLRRAKLWRANLRGADLRGARLIKADFRGANLEGAKLEGAKLDGAELHRATFYGRGGRIRLRGYQVETFLEALGFVVID